MARQMIARRNGELHRCAALVTEFHGAAGKIPSSAEFVVVPEVGV
jgi:hypothetical protein